MSFQMITKPSLIEPGVIYFLSNTLNRCKEYKNIYYNTLFNILLGFGFCVILGMMLLYKYKGKASPSELARKEREKQQYILSKIKKFQDTKKIVQQSLITGLPSWDTL